MIGGAMQSVPPPNGVDPGSVLHSMIPGLRFRTLEAVTLKSSMGPEIVGEPVQAIDGVQPRELSLGVQYAAGGTHGVDDGA